MVLDVIDNLAVMSVFAGRVQNSGVGLEGVEVPFQMLAGSLGMMAYRN